jgi:hypothetical protein
VAVRGGRGEERVARLQSHESVHRVLADEREDHEDDSWVGSRGRGKGVLKMRGMAHGLTDGDIVSLVMSGGEHTLHINRALRSLSGKQAPRGRGGSVRSERLSSGQRRGDGRGGEVGEVAVVGGCVWIDRREGRESRRDKVRSELLKREGSGGGEASQIRLIRCGGGGCEFGSLFGRLERDVPEMVSRVESLLRGRGCQDSLFPESLLHGVDLHIMVR